MERIVLRIRELREARGLSQAELADRAEVRRATIADHETGRAQGVDFDVLDRIARALDVAPGALIDRVTLPRDPIPPRKGRPPRKPSKGHPT